MKVGAFSTHMGFLPNCFFPRHILSVEHVRKDSAKFSKKKSMEWIGVIVGIVISLVMIIVMALIRRLAHHR